MRSRMVALGLLSLLLTACGTNAAATPTVEFHTGGQGPVATSSPLQLTAQAVQQQQRAKQSATQVAAQAVACAQLRDEYVKYGQAFSLTTANTNPEQIIVEMRLMHYGNGEPPTSTLGRQSEDHTRANITTCVGR